jgi:hypothetical protein
MVYGKIRGALASRRERRETARATRLKVDTARAKKELASARAEAKVRGMREKAKSLRGPSFGDRVAGVVKGAVARGAARRAARPKAAGRGPSWLGETPMTRQGAGGAPSWMTQTGGSQPWMARPAAPKKAPLKKKRVRVIEYE